MDPITVAAIALRTGAGINKFFGDECPKCGCKSRIDQTDKGNTWFGNKKKIECGDCGHVFKVKIS